MHLIPIYILGKAKSISSFGHLPKSCVAYYKDTDTGTAGKELKADSDTVELIVL